jgi:hypothetical protein
MCVKCRILESAYSENVLDDDDSTVNAAASLSDHDWLLDGVKPHQRLVLYNLLCIRTSMSDNKGY